MAPPFTTAVEATRRTFGDVCDQYLKTCVRVPTRRESAVEMFEIHVGVLRRAESPASGTPR